MIMIIPAILTSIIEELDNDSPLHSPIVITIALMCMHYLILLILFVKSHLIELNMCGNDFGRAIPFLSEAVKITKRIDVLILHNCNIDDKGLDYLAKASRKRSCFTLDVTYNFISSWSGNVLVGHLVQFTLPTSN